jgi:hypothetical protein
MSPKFQKRSELKFVGRIIPHAKLSGPIYDNPQLAAESFSKACFGVHTRDFKRKSPDRCNTKLLSKIHILIFESLLGIMPGKSTF